MGLLTEKIAIVSENGQSSLFSLLQAKTLAPKINNLGVAHISVDSVSITEDNIIPKTKEKSRRRGRGKRRGKGGGGGDGGRGERGRQRKRKVKKYNFMNF